MDVYTVSQLTRYIREYLDIDPNLQDLWVEGEVSNVSQAVSGHLYFTLKDESSQIACVMWRSQVEQQARLPQAGEAILAHGHISVYEARGAYQFYVDYIEAAGAGALFLEFEALKAKLEAEGLFAAERKRALPEFPQRIGVATSPTGAVLRDIVHILGRRYPIAVVILAPTLVQGPDAPPQIVEAIRALNDFTEVDLIIVARGGGSLEELWAFNDQSVARAIAASRVPVISGVGHETDFTIADFVADVRAPTPSAAAELAVPDRGELRSIIDRLTQQLGRMWEQTIDEWRLQLGRQEEALQRLSPWARIADRRQRNDELLRSASLHLRHRLEVKRERVQSLSLRLASLSPYTTLARGYSITTHYATGRIVTSVAQIASGDAVDVRVSDGTFGAKAI